MNFDWMISTETWSISVHFCWFRLISIDFDWEMRNLYRRMMDLCQEMFILCWIDNRYFYPSQSSPWTTSARTSAQKQSFSVENRWKISHFQWKSSHFQSSTSTYAHLTNISVQQSVYYGQFVAICGSLWPIDRPFQWVLGPFSVIWILQLRIQWGTVLTGAGTRTWRIDPSSNRTTTTMRPTNRWV